MRGATASRFPRNWRRGPVKLKVEIVPDKLREQQERAHNSSLDARKSNKSPAQCSAHCRSIEGSRGHHSEQNLKYDLQRGNEMANGTSRAALGAIAPI